MEYDKDNERIRWVAYFDMLGTRNRIELEKTQDVFLAYDIAYTEYKK
jgi:hypothetical protein